MLINLKHDGLQDEGGGRNRVECLLRLGQPVDEVLQRVVELGGQSQGLFQFNLKTRTYRQGQRISSLNSHGGYGFICVCMSGSWQDYTKSTRWISTRTQCRSKNYSRSRSGSGGGSRNIHLLSLTLQFVRFLLISLRIEWILTTKKSDMFRGCL